MVEVGLGGVDGDDRRLRDPQDGVPAPEELLEVDVAHVPGVVVARDHDEVLALDPVEVGAGLRVLLLEAEGGQVTGADDDVRRELVDLADRPLEQVGQEVLAAAVQVRELHDREGAGCGHAGSLGAGRDASVSIAARSDARRPGRSQKIPWIGQ